MDKQERGTNSVTEAEVGVIRNLLKRSEYTNQDILKLINSVRRYEGRDDINSGRISDIKSDKPLYDDIIAASDTETDDFVLNAEKTATYSSVNNNPFDDNRLRGLFHEDKKTKGKLSLTETDRVECKEAFGTTYLISNCLKAFAAFANNKGGYLVFGVTDKTWEVKGIDGAKYKAFDRKKFNQALLSSLSCAINFDMETFEVCGKTIGVMFIHPAAIKPVITVTNKGDIKSGHIYYRYQAENRLIGSAELQNIIEERIRELSETILTKHLSTIMANGIENSAVLNLNTGLVDGKSGSFYIDEDILPKISFIKEGEFQEKSGAPTLTFIGEVKKATAIIKTKHKDLLKLYPYSWNKVREAVKNDVLGANQIHVNKIIKEHSVKSNPDYAAYNFRNNKQSEEYEKSGLVPTGTSSIYNDDAKGFICEKAIKMLEK